MHLPAVVLFTDFTLHGPYVGQMAAAIGALSPESRLIHLMHDAPAMRPDLAAYLLPAACARLPGDTVVVAVVDPGVGGDRRALIVETAAGHFVGPDNGLLSRLPAMRRVWQIDWRPEQISASFHGRDLFGPVAARIARGDALPRTALSPTDLVGADWPDNLPAVTYIDHFGNLMTGISLTKTKEINRLVINDQSLPRARTFSDVPHGSPFWYENSLGLLEIAVNGGSAAEYFRLALGDKILLE